MASGNEMTELALFTESFERLGFEVIYYSGIKNTNGPDAWVKKPSGKPMSVEIKSARRGKNGCWVVNPVSEPRRKDDLIAIRCGGKYFLVESMEDHLKCCSRSGQRQMTKLLGDNP